MPANIWTYAGESGKRLDATVREFTVTDPGLVFGTLDTDSLSWALPLQSLVPTSEVFPEEGQLVSLFRNGQRFFRGHALRPDQSEYRIGVEVVGPWHWLEKIPLSTAVALDAASGGGTGQRATIGFPAQSMTVSLGTLFDRCIALGAPMIKGAIATTFSCIPVTVNQGSCAQAIIDLVRLIGDMSVWFDYSATTGHPIINVTRRRQGLAVGSAAIASLSARELLPGQFKITPQDEMRVSLVRVPFLDRAPVGTRRNQEQKAGVAETGHELLLTASGEELDTFLPDENLDSYQIQTSSVNLAAILNGDSQIVSAAATFGVAPTSLPLAIGGTSIPIANGTNAWNTVSNVVIPAPTVTDPATGTAVNMSGKSLLLTPNPPDWLGKLYTLQPVKISAQVYYQFTEKSGSTTFKVPAWWFNVSWDANERTGIATSGDTVRIFIHQAVFDAFVINASFAGVTENGNAQSTPVGGDTNLVSLDPGANAADGYYVGKTLTWTRSSTVRSSTIVNYTGSTKLAALNQVWSSGAKMTTGNPYTISGLSQTINKPADYTFIAPPSGFAQGLLNARNWTPYTGNLGWMEQDCGATRYLGKVINVTGADPAFESMQAMVQSEELDINRGITRLRLGPPARLAFKSLLDQTRTHSTDQIVFL